MPGPKRKCSDGVSMCKFNGCQCKTDHKCFCGNQIKLPGSSFCSQKCHGLSRTRPKVEAWLKGEIDANGANGRDRAGLAGWARAYLLEEAGYACTQCGWDTPHPDTGIPPLEVDHIDGNRNNNLRSNVRVLCPNCHALTPTNKGRNRNKYLLSGA